MSGREGARNPILFVCIENSSRSVMAEAFAKQVGLEASSAGTVPATHVNPLVVEVMKEVGIDVSRGTPKKLTESMIEGAGTVVLTDASLEKSMPRNLWRKMRKKVLEWSIPDPQGRLIEEVRFVRDEIKAEVRKLAEGTPSPQS